MNDIIIDEGLAGKELFDFLVKNKTLLINQKKYSIKHADAFSYSLSTSPTIITKATDANNDVLEVSTIINTTNFIDSHKDVHIPGIWDKSLKENKNLYLLQEHQMTFKGIITDNVNAYTKNIKWKDLGYNAEGETQALIFDNKIEKTRNPFMANEYAAGRVKNHSVGMKYVRIEMAVNDADYKDEFAVWNKYYDQIANKEEADAAGYFFAVKEAKAIEGSAVPIGSNRMTPVFNTKTDTVDAPPDGTHPQPLQKSFDISLLIKNLNIS